MLEIIGIIGALGSFAVFQWQSNQQIDGRLDALKVDVITLQRDLVNHMKVSELSMRYQGDLLSKIERKLEKQ